jgi:hypothetical protein
MSDLRRVLRFLYYRPWSSITEISTGTKLSTKAVSAMIKSDLALRTEKRFEEGKTTVTYSLPVPERVEDEGVSSELPSH